MQIHNYTFKLYSSIMENISEQDSLDLNGTFEGLDYGPLFPATIPSNPPVKMDDNLTMPWWAQTAWTLVFTLMITIAIGGNCIVMWIVIVKRLLFYLMMASEILPKRRLYNGVKSIRSTSNTRERTLKAHRRMRTVTNYFLVNLSMADFLLSTLNCFFNFVYMLQGHWRFGSWYCTVNNFIANVTVAASVFTLTSISWDRYLAIVHPLQPRMSKTSSLVTIVFIWFASMVSAFPCLLYSTTVTYRYRNNIRIACILVWPDGQPTDSNMDFAYQVIFLIVTYLVPMILMVACYTSMGRVLWGSRSIGEMTQRQLDSIKSKRKVVRMFFLIVLIFGLCWLPYHGYFIYTHYDRQVLYSKYVQHVYLAFYWFAMANAMVNPLIYYWMNARFRQYFRTALCGWRNLFRKRSRRQGTENPPIIGSHSFSKSGTIDRFKTPLRRTSHKCEEIKLRHTIISRLPTEHTPRTEIAGKQEVNFYNCTDNL